MTEETAAHQLEGLELEDGWKVVSKIPDSEDRTGGAFSVSYVVRHTSGRLGFCKALDFAKALQDPDPTRELQTMVNLYEFERDLLFRCGRRRLSRVVRALAAGTVRVAGASPDAVSYLILELADGDAHDLVDEADTSDCLTGLRAAHHAAVGLSQLHREGVAHQDVKPSNLLAWREGEQFKESKLGDLGSAHDSTLVSPYDGLAVAGDPSYAAPETLYRGADFDPSRWRRAADFYMFGNLLCFLVCGVPFSGLQQRMYLPPELHWRHGGEFNEVLPYLVDSHGRSVERVREVLHEEGAVTIAQMLWELCHPDPSERGDPMARRAGRDPFSLTRYVTRIDLLLRRIEVGRGSSPRAG